MMHAVKIPVFRASPPKPEKSPTGGKPSSTLSSLVKARPSVTIDSDFPGEAALTTMRNLRVPPLEKVTKPFFD